MLRAATTGRPVSMTWQSQVQVALEVGGVDHLDDGIGARRSCR